MSTLTKTSPDIRVRKLMGDWCVQRRLVLLNHEVWSLVAAYTSWHIAFAVAQVEASPDTWPFHLEACS